MAPVRLTTRVFISPEISRALFTFSLRGTDFPPLGPSSAVTTKEAPQSVILLASASGEKPPKTTECTAPILAQANIAYAASGIIGI